jgi:trehalose 6-phosphate phosphatase
MLEGLQAGAGQPAPRLALFTDFDGTLVDIADTPDGIAVPDGLTEELDAAAERFGHALAVITGRRIADIDLYLDQPAFAIAGSHGAERRRADGTLIIPTDDMLAGAEAIADRLRPFVEAHDGLLLEVKDAAVALHFRQAPDEEAASAAAIRDAATDVGGFSVIAGKQVFEARPTGIDKGEAVRAFMQEEPFLGRLPIFIGDDLTDEDGFRAAQDLGGVGIKLGPGDTTARLRIADVAAAHALIRGLAERQPEGDAQ